MANQKLLIDIIARDKTKQAFNGLQSWFIKTKKFCI